LSGQKLVVLSAPQSLSLVQWCLTCVGLQFAGCTTLPELQDASNSIHPDVYTNSVYDLVGLLQK
jgi:hypothetical protein